MATEVLQTIDAIGITKAVRGGQEESSSVHGRYEFTCHDKDGNLKWVDHIDNVVTTVGKNDMLDKYLAGSSYTATWYLGLISATGYTSTPVVGDTMASHSTWAEDQNYSESSRPTAVFAAASAGSKALNAPLAYTINATTTVKGGFLNSVATKGGTTGVLFSAGLFTGGDKSVVNGDTISATYSASLT